MTDQSSKWSMRGSNPGTIYSVVAATGRGSIGICQISPDRFRIRIEPTFEGMMELEQFFRREDGWKQPGDGWDRDNRFSLVVKRRALKRQVRYALYAMVSDCRPFEVNQGGLHWATKLLSREALVAHVREFKWRGANLAARWSIKSLQQRLILTM